MEGCIVKIRLKDFVTFHDLTVYPDSQLNLVTGPNGSGKSSLMCAMCLGLAGKPKVVGRASDVSDYIRYNAEKAKIELELLNPNSKNYVVSRTIFRDNKSSWTVDGQTCTQKEVEKLTSKLNIQIDNLCQFLPQDRVQDFAKMNSQTLMENTEKAVGGLKMWENHMKLKELGNVYVENEKKLAARKENLTSEEQSFASLQAAVNQISAKKNLTIRLEKLKQKLAFKAYEKQKNDVKMSETLYMKKVSFRKDLEKEIKPLELNVKNRKSQIKALEDKYLNVGNIYSKHNSACEDSFELPEAINDKIKENSEEFGRWCLNEKKRMSKLEDIRRLIRCLETNLEQIPETEDELRKQESTLVHEEIQQMKIMDDLQRSKQSLEAQIVNVEHKIRLNNSELEKFNDVGLLKLRKMKSKGLYEPIMWLRENKIKFKGKVYEPMAMMINMKDASMAKYLENIVPHRDIIAFVCENADDANILMEELRDKRKYKVNVITSKPTVAMSSFTRPYEMSVIQEFGFHSYVSDIFTAPETIMRYLFSNYQIHKIPIGNDTTYQRASEVPKDIRIFMTGDQKFTIRKSKYSSETVSSSTNLKPASMLTASLNEAHIRECRNRNESLDKELKEFQKEMASFEAQESQLVDKVKKIKESKSEIKQKIAQINNSRARIATYRRNEREMSENTGNEEEQRNKLTKSNQEQVMRLVAILGKNVSHLKKFGDIINLMRISHKDVYKSRNDISFLEHELRTSNKKLMEALKDEKNCKNIFDETQLQAERYLKQLEDLTKLKYNSKPFHILLEEFKKLPKEVDVIKMEIHEVQTKIDCLGHSDNNVVVEYERRKASVTALKSVVDKLSEDLSQMKSTIEELKAEWLPFVNELVKKINTTFGDLLSKINYVGEISLVKGQTEEDYSGYGFKIQVKFRQEGGLQELNQFRQSGGERAVAIAIYLMSLQELTSVPFRCVDEINQGMDEFHEAVVFKLLSDIVSESGTAQYFLFTPKVLKTLQFPNTMLYICINNGEIDLKEEVFNIRNVVKRKRALQLKHQGR